MSSDGEPQTGIRNSTICVVGLGYVGLPLAIEFDREEFDVIGYDIDTKKIELLNQGVDPTNEMGDSAIQRSSAVFTDDETTIENADFILITVPTPVDDLKNPNLSYVENAAKVIGRTIKKDAIVILESTVYPGATRELLAPTIEEASGMVAGTDFFVGYSPERMVPGDTEHGIRDIVKIVSGQNDEILAKVSALYKTIVDAGVHEAPTIEVAEAAKAIENIQRDVNIALMNELAIACNSIGIDTQDVLEAARTKWNFHDYRPGLVGGHCIPVDPFFMIYESERNGFSPKLIEQSREVNDFVPVYVADMILRGLNDCGKVLRDSKVLILGLAYKPGVGDIRTSIIDHTIDHLEEYGVEVIGVDPFANKSDAKEEFNIPIQDVVEFAGMDAVVLATPHDQFLELDYIEYSEEMKSPPLLVDIGGVLDRESLEKSDINYWRL